MSRFLTPQQLAAQRLGLVPDAGLVYAARAHLLPLTVADVSSMVCDFPVLVSRNSEDGTLMLSALCSFVPGHNLLADAQGWHAVYRPLSLQAYPCYCLLQDGQRQFVFAADPQVLQPAAMPLFADDGAADAAAQRLMHNAQELYDQERRTYLSLQQLQALKLLRPIELQVQPDQGELQRIRGLMTIDEDQLHSVDATTLKTLQQTGSLQLAQSLLNSLLQLNRLIQRHNQRAALGQPGFHRIQQLKIEIDRDSGFL